MTSIRRKFLVLLAVLVWACGAPSNSNDPSQPFEIDYELVGFDSTVEISGIATQRSLCSTSLTKASGSFAASPNIIGKKVGTFRWRPKLSGVGASSKGFLSADLTEIVATSSIDAYVVTETSTTKSCKALSQTSPKQLWGLQVRVNDLEAATAEVYVPFPPIDPITGANLNCTNGCDPHYGLPGGAGHTGQPVAMSKLMGLEAFDVVFGGAAATDNPAGGGTSQGNFAWEGTLTLKRVCPPAAATSCIAKDKWDCTSSCNVEGTQPNCAGRVTGSASGSSEGDACREAKPDATQKAPAGCYARHCQCSCTQR